MNQSLLGSPLEANREGTSLVHFDISTKYKNVTTQFLVFNLITWVIALCSFGSFSNNLCS